MISWKMAAAWVAALVVTTVLTWQIVGLADSQVGDAPVAVAPVSPSTVNPTTSTTSATTSTSIPATTSTSSQATTTSTPVSGSSAPTTQGSTTPPPTATNVDWTVRTINSEGGTVIVRHRPGEVELQAATPAAGFSVEIDDSGPTRVRVEFEGDDDDIRVEVEWDDGELEVSVDD